MIALKPNQERMLDSLREFFWQLLLPGSMLAVGEIWASRSGGRCLFVMPTDGQFGPIMAAIRSPREVHLRTQGQPLSGE